MIGTRHETSQIGKCRPLQLSCLAYFLTSAVSCPAKLHSALAKVAPKMSWLFNTLQSPIPRIHTIRPFNTPSITPLERTDCLSYFMMVRSIGYLHCGVQSFLPHAKYSGIPSDNQMKVVSPPRLYRQTCMMVVKGIVVPP